MDVDYPYTPADDERLAAAMGGAATVAELNALRLASGTDDGPWRSGTIGGYCSRFNQDIRMSNLNEQFSVVYWGGIAAEGAGLWSFQICRRRDDNPRFDDRVDFSLSLATHHLQVYTRQANKKSYFQEGGLITHEGSVVILEYKPPHGPGHTIIPITFPTRAVRRPLFINSVTLR